MRLLAVNAGSSSLKLQVLDVGPPAAPGPGLASGPGSGPRSVAPAPGPGLASGPGSGPRSAGDSASDSATLVGEAHVDGWDGDDVAPISALVAEWGPVDAVGHRVVHGGSELRSAVVVDDEVVRRIEELVPLAPLHQGRSLAGIAAARKAAPDVPHVACFDTAYHATLPEAAATYALPAVWRERWPLRRFGFHGLSHAYAARQAAALVADREAAGPGGLRVVTCHLGAGASLCASLGGRSVDTTMGFTPLEGLVMATRSGSVDPGLVLWLITEAGLAPDAVRRALEHDSGLVGLAGTGDMREVVAEGGLALDVYVHVLARAAASMTAALGGLDALVFTGGVGEHAPVVRARAAERLAYLGVEIDPARNQPTPPAPSSPPAFPAPSGSTAPSGPSELVGDRDVSAPGAPVATLVVAAREDLEIARQAVAVLSPR